VGWLGEIFGFDEFNKFLSEGGHHLVIVFSKSVFNMFADFRDVFISNKYFLFFSNFVNNFFANFFKSVHVSVGNCVMERDHFDGLLSKLGIGVNIIIDHFLDGGINKFKGNFSLVFVFLLKVVKGGSGSLSGFLGENLVIG
jgi:hypothetical protein